MECRKCFVPTCKNDSKNSPNKIFVRVREDLREKWCREAKAEYFKVYTMYCCEDHFEPMIPKVTLLQPREDLMNYYQCKLMNQEPRLKRSALLRNIGQDTSGTSELHKLLFLQHTPSNKTSKRKHVNTKIGNMSISTSKMSKEKCKDVVMPSTSTSSTLLKKNEEMLERETRERETRERVTRERETQERETRERETLERETRERETRERETRERETRERETRERETREREAREREARERETRERETREREAREREARERETRERETRERETRERETRERETQEREARERESRAKTKKKPKPLYNQDPEQMLPEIREMIAQVHWYLEHEFEQLKIHFGISVDLSVLSDIVKRTAMATGVRQSAVVAILEANKRPDEPVEGVCEKRAELGEEDDGEEIQQAAPAQFEIETLKVELPEDDDGPQSYSSQAITSFRIESIPTTSTNRQSTLQADTMTSSTTVPSSVAPKPGTHALVPTFFIMPPGFVLDELTVPGAPDTPVEPVAPVAPVVEIKIEPVDENCPQSSSAVDPLAIDPLKVGVKTEPPDDGDVTAEQ